MKHRHFRKRNHKRGASLLMVLVSVSVLVVMGTLFTTIAMRSYNYSYAKLCRQQAYYTAESSIKGLYKLIAGDTSNTVITQIRGDIESEYQEEMSAGNIPVNAPITQVRAEIGKVGGSSDESGSSIISGGVFDNMLGQCTLYARYTTTRKNELSLEAHATYRGYTEVAKAKIARTNKAAEELKKIFDNTFCMNTPVNAFVVGKTLGDTFISTPSSDVKPTSDIPYVPGQYIRNADGEIITSGVAGDYNRRLSEQVYNNIQAGGTADSTVTVHTRPTGMDALPLYGDDGKTLFYNDWVELFMFSSWEDDGQIAIDGDLYSTSRILIGLWDKNTTNDRQIRYWDESRRRKELFALPDENYEHGRHDLFFDGAGLNHESTKFRINGNMYLWEDARIENFDSVNTPNAQKGIKNNIYAQKDLYIDGFRYKGVSNGTPQSDRNNVIFGDVVVQGNLFIGDTIIFGDVYCYGDDLTIIDSDIYGNIYHNGYKFQADWMTVGGTVQSPKSVSQIMNDYGLHFNWPSGTDQVVPNGGNVVVKGEGAPANYKDLMASYNGLDGWGVFLTNCSVYGTLYSNVNTKIDVEKWGTWATIGNDGPIDRYNNVVVDGVLCFDLRYEYVSCRTEPDTAVAARFNHVDVPTDERYASNSPLYNGLRQTAIKAADKVYILGAQSGGHTDGKLPSQTHYGNVFVGTGGCHIDGNSAKATIFHEDRQTIWMNSFYSAGPASAWDVRSEKGYFGILPAGTNQVGSKNPSLATTAFASYYNNYVQPQYAGIGGAMSVQDMYDNVYTYLTGELPDKMSEELQKDYWEEKVINMRKWSAPPAANTAEEAQDGTKVYYRNATSFTGGANPLATTNARGELVIDSSAIVNDSMQIPDNTTVYFDTSGGNLHIQFKSRLIIGNNCRLILRGGNMVFFYLYSDSAYSIAAPDLVIGDGTQVGMVEELPGVERRSDSIYFVSNDDILIQLGGNSVLNGFVYAPEGHLMVQATTGERGHTILNGCLAIEGQVFQNIGTEGILDVYSRFVYNYLVPPLIVDGGFGFGDTTDEVIDFSQIVWEFMGFY